MVNAKSLEEARRILLSQVLRRQQNGIRNVRREPFISGNSGIVRLEVPLESSHSYCPFRPLEWLALQDCPQKIYWANRPQNEQFAGLGEALKITDGKSGYEKILQQLNELLQNAPQDVRFYGGMRFDADAPLAPEWQKWGTAHFILPLIELSIVDGRATLAAHLVLKNGIDEELQRLQKTLDSLRIKDITIPDTPLIQLERRDLPEYRQWCNLVEQGLEAVTCGKLDKVVLARTAVFNLARDYDPMELLLQLRRQAPQAFHFCFQLAPDIPLAPPQSFLGITPERLYRRSGRQSVPYIESEAVAGTRPRGQTLEDDERLAAELRESKKEQREHLMVLERMERLLQQFCRNTERLSYLERLPLRHVQHLQSRVQGTLRPGIKDSDLLPAFHPTPAVSGTPDAEARALIRELEPFDRGWYAGPVGWVSNKQAEFAVGIRSGLLEGRTLRVFTGAGIVEGSIPAEEWREIEVKLQSWQSLLNKF